MTNFNVLDDLRQHDMGLTEMMRMMMIANDDDDDDSCCTML